MQYNISEFASKQGLPNCVALLDGSHFVIQRPSLNASSYYSGRKKIHSFNIQIACDAFGYIVNLVTGWPGSVHDSRVFRNSTLFRLAESRSILNGPAVTVNGVQIGQYILAD